MRKTIIILGMHRSGTSMIAGLITKMGISMGDDLLGKNPSNPFGHFEDRDFYNINREVLSKANGSWDNPPNEKNILAQADLFNKRIEKLIKKKNNNRDIWGWKDPRTSLTIKLYMPYLINPYFIFCHRQDVKIAESLKRRDDFEIQKGLDLTNIYNDRIKNFFQEYENFKKIDLYYEEFFAHPRQNIRKIVDFLSLEISKENIGTLSRFITSKEKIRKISKRVLILKYLKKGFARPWKIPSFIYKKLKK